MTYTVTGSIYDTDDINTCNNGFKICEFTEKSESNHYSVKVYYKTEKDVDWCKEMYVTNENYDYRYFHVDSISDAMDSIVSDIINNKKTVVSSEETDQDEETKETEQTAVEEINVVAAYNKTDTMLKEKLEAADNTISYLNLFDYLQVDTIYELGKVSKSMLKSDFVFPENPISYADSVYKMMNGVNTQ